MNYNGIEVNWTPQEEAKIAEIKARREKPLMQTVAVEDEPNRQHLMDLLERKIVRSKAMYWLWRAGAELNMIADLFDLPIRKTREAIETVRGGKVEMTRYRKGLEEKL